MATQVWSGHLADITRALKIIEDADKALKEDYRLSDLEFNLPKRISIETDGLDTGWAIVWSEDLDCWAAEFGEVEK